MAEKALSVQDICKIIASCHKYGVTELTFGELHVLVKPNHKNPEKVFAESTPTAAIPEEKQEIIVANAEAEKLAEEKVRTSFLVLEDPLELERRIANGELIDEIADDR